MAYPVPENERGRLTALDAYDVLGTPAEMDFDEIAEMASHICGCPVGVINLVADIYTARAWGRNAQINLDSPMSER